MPHLKIRLKNAYEKHVDFLHTNLGKEFEEEAESDRSTSALAAQEIADLGHYPWTAFSEIMGGRRRTMYACDLHHERFPFGTHCAECLANEEALEAEIAGCEGAEEVCGVQPFAGEWSDKDPIEKCAIHQVWFTGTCPHCTEAGLPKSTPKSDDAEKTRCCCTTNGGDRRCRRKLAFICEISLIGKKRGYCTRHWNKCSDGKCDGDAIFTGLDGQRWCHIHSRRKSGIADKAAQLGGEFNVTEVR